MNIVSLKASILLRLLLGIPKKVVSSYRYILYKSLVESSQTAISLLSKSEQTTVVAFFADAPVNLYQVRQWYEQLRELNNVFRVIVVSFHPRTFNALSREAGVPIVFVSSMRRYEQIMGDIKPSAVLYFNHNRANLSSMVHRDALTIYLSHGESEKPYMTWGQIRAYDFHFIAGNAAYNRLAKHMINYDVSKRTRIIGRPQADFLDNLCADIGALTTVIYAPTREGDRDSMNLSSVKSIGVNLVSQILAQGHRLIYRPHPALGTNDSSYKAAHLRILDIIVANNKNIRDTRLHSVYDCEPSIDWQILESSICVTDMSAFGFDFLASSKPIILLLPDEYSPVSDEATYLDAVYSLSFSDVDRFTELLSESLHADSLSEARHSCARYYYDGLGVSPATPRFIQAVAEIVQIQRSECSRLAAG